MTKEFRLDPTTLPAAPMLELAQSGFLVRAERETPENGVPAFMLSEDWKTLEHRFASNNAEHAKTGSGLLSAVENATRRLMGHAAEALANSAPGEIGSTLSLRTDLFAENAETFLSFLRDQTYEVACLVIGPRPWASVALPDQV
ncbi:hypothetical protein [Asaia krungthepensis]|uniref:Uncharacterized protein n=1 Tax=Asaia krungthepensis NRIC 0535 TaxID=1307925 RepID=A0ABQ0Q607_9PROT|nr:hypothetical protein [Asaia krungthepensis]GBQ93074.1 hypothetical protein AA0535_2732 [Asaia krungthepensis NRIC 0535]